MSGRPTRLWIATGVLCAALSFDHAARGETTGLRGIAADVAAARRLDEAKQANARREETDIELSQLTSQRLQAEQSVRSRVRALYRITRAGMAPVSGGFEAVRRHVARVKRLTSLVENDLSVLRRVEARERNLRVKADQRAAQVARAREDLGGSHQPLMAASPQAIPAGAMPASSGGFYGLRLADSAESSDFATRHGRLATPVAGEVRLVDARRRESQGSGLEFQAPAGTSVRAAAPGRVAFCDRYGSYGRLVIVDHGDGYYTAYGGLGSDDVRVGDDVSAFARLGSIGAEGNTPALYFEIRKGVKTLAPRAWLGL